MDVVKVEPHSDDDEPLLCTSYHHVMVKEEVHKENQASQFSFVGVKCENVDLEVGSTYPVQLELELPQKEKQPNDKVTDSEMMDQIKAETDSAEDLDPFSSNSETHGMKEDERVPFTFVAVNNEPKFQPGELLIKEEQKCEISFEEHEPNVDGVRFGSCKGNGGIFDRQKIRRTKGEMAARVKQRQFFGDEEFEEFIVDSDSDCEFSGDLSDSTESEDDTVVRRQKGVKSYGRVANHDLGTSHLGDEIAEPPFISPKRDSAPDLDPFTAAAGVRTAVAYPSEPMQTAALFMHDRWWLHLVNETNRYYSQNSKVGTSSKYNKWRDVTVEEMKKFVGLWIITGHVWKPILRLYWSTDELISTPIFPKTMTRNRFCDILTYLHFNDNEARPKDDQDRLYKVRPLISMFCVSAQKHYVPHQNILLDEAVIPWRGRLNFRIYNPGKAKKFGILVRMVSEASTGYVHNLFVYSGTEVKLRETIMALCAPYIGKGYHLYMDNHYDSVPIARNLLRHKVRVCGTIQKNQGLPREFQVSAAKLKMGERMSRRSGDVLLVSWRDRRLVNMISTIHADKLVIVTQNGSRTKRPECVAQHGKYMAGIEQMDQYMAYYSFARRGSKWTKKVFMHITHMGLLNAYLIYSKLNPGTKKTHREYLLDVARSLIAGTQVGPRCDPPADEGLHFIMKRPPHEDPAARLSGIMSDHRLMSIPPTSKRKYPSRHCRVCLRHKKRGETRYFCSSCQVPLHKGECFTWYHTKKQY